MIHSFLIIGQSNMAGRGSLTDAEPLDTRGGHIKVLRNGRWQTAFRPINPDRIFSGTCLAESFSQAYFDDHPDVDVGIIPCADGGTSIDQWAEGEILFDNAVNSAKLAMRTSHLVGILWHQGEGDCASVKHPLYYDKLSAMMKALRSAIGKERLPVIVGGLGDFLAHCDHSATLVNYGFINEHLMRYAEENEFSAFASAEGLTANPDLLHFDHNSLRKFGRRYYEAFKTLESKELISDEEIKLDDSKRTEMESL